MAGVIVLSLAATTVRAQRRPAPVVVTERTASVVGSNVRYLVAGPTSGPTVVFLHGGRYEANTWNGLGSLERCAKRGYRAIAVDLPGHGGSDASKVEPLEFMEALLPKLDVKRPVLVTASASGRFAMEFAARHSDRLAGLLPDATVHLFEGGRHAFYLDTPNLFHEVLLDFLDRVFADPDRQDVKAE